MELERDLSPVTSLFILFCSFYYGESETSNITSTFRYFLAEDQFFVFFLSLVMLINGRDYVMQLAESVSVRVMCVCVCVCMCVCVCVCMCVCVGV